MNYCNLAQIEAINFFFVRIADLTHQERPMTISTLKTLERNLIISLLEFHFDEFQIFANYFAGNLSFCIIAEPIM